MNSENERRVLHYVMAKAFAGRRNPLFTVLLADAWLRHSGATSAEQLAALRLFKEACISAASPRAALSSLSSDAGLIMPLTAETPHSSVSPPVALVGDEESSSHADIPIDIETNGEKWSSPFIPRLQAAAALDGVAMASASARPIPLTSGSSTLPPAVQVGRAPIVPEKASSGCGCCVVQ